jgi:Arabinose-binding domain of AraC transcription regulator, N-term
VQFADEILATVTRNLLGSVDGRGAERAELLAAAQLDESALSDPDGWVPIRAHVQLGRAIMAAFPSENLGLQTGYRIFGDPRGTLGYALRRSALLWRALGNFGAYLAVVNRAMEVELVAGASGCAVTLHMTPELAAICHPAEALFAAWVGISRHLTAERWCPELVTFTHPAQGDPAEHAEFFGCPVHFERAQTALRIPASACQLTIATAPHELEGGLAAASAAARAFVDGAAAERDLEALTVALATAPLDVRAVAGRASSAARLALAHGLLVSSRMLVHEIAFLLGFADLRAFEREVAERFGAAPRQLRSQA